MKEGRFTEMWKENEKRNHFIFGVKYKENITDVDSQLFSICFLPYSVNLILHSYPYFSSSKSINNLFSELVTLTTLKFAGI